MDISAISDIISTARKGTRIPEELLGLPSRSARYERLSMDAIGPVSGLRASRVSDKTKDAASVQETGTASLSDVVGSLITSAAGNTQDKTFSRLLAEAIDAQTTATKDGTSSLLSDPEYYRNLMMLSSFSSNYIAGSLATTGTAGASTFGLTSLDI